MSRRRVFFAAFLLLVALLVLGVWRLPQANFFWQWGADQLVKWAQERVHGEVVVQKVSGDALRGIVLEGITVRGPQGEVLQADRLELTLSWWSFVKLQPVFSKLTFSGLRLNLAQGPDGRWNVAGLLKKKPPPPFRTINFRKISLKGAQVSFTQEGATQVFREVDLDMALTIRNPRRPNQAVLVHKASLNFTLPQGRYGLFTRFTYDQDCLRLLSLTVESGDRTWLTLAGEIRDCLSQPTLLLEGLLGPIKGEEFCRFMSRWPPAWNLEGSLKLNGPLEQLRLEGSGQLGGTPFVLSGEMSWPLGPRPARLRANFKGLEKAWWGLVGAPKASPADLPEGVNARAEVKLTGPPWASGQLEATMELEPFRYRQAHIEQLKLSLAGDLNQQNLEGLLRGNFGRIAGQVRGQLLPAGDVAAQGDLKLTLEGVQPILWGGSPSLAHSLHGQFQGQFLLPVACHLSGAQVSGEVQARGQWGDQPFQELKARIGWDGQKLVIPQAVVVFKPLALEFKGEVQSSGLALQFNAAVNSREKWPFLPLSVTGHLKGEGTLKGSLQALQLAFSGTCRQLSWPGGELASGTVTLSATGWPPLAGRLDLKGAGFATPAGTLSQAALTTQGEGGKWTFKFQGASGREAEAALKGSADFSARPWAVLLETCRWRSPQLDLANVRPVELRFLPGWELLPAEFRLNGGTVSLRGRAQGPELTGKLEAQGIPADWLKFQGRPLTGRLSAQARLSGTPQAPLLEGRLNWGPGRVGNFSVESFTTDITYQDGRLKLRGHLEEKRDGPRLTWEGHLPCRVSLWPVKFSLEDQEMDFRLRGEKTTLSLLTALTREVQAADGELDIKAEVRGRPAQPRVSGHLRWNDGWVQFRLAGAPWRLLKGEGRLEGSGLHFSQILFQNGGGTARISGTITFQDLSPHQVKAQAQLENFLTVSRSGSQAWGTGSLTLTGPWAGALLKGRLKVTQANFRPVFFRGKGHDDIQIVRPAPPPEAAGAPPPPRPHVFWQNLTMRITLEAPRKVAIEDVALKVELGGTLEAIKNPGQPVVLKGTMKALKGTYRLQGRDFKVEQGAVHFPGVPKELITMEGRAVHKLEDLTLMLSAAGPAARPRVRLESIPALPPGDLLSYLVFGRPARSLTREQHLTVSQQAMGILGGISAHKLQEVLGKDFPLLKDVSMTGSQDRDQQRVGVATKVTRDITVSYERKLQRWGPDPPTQVRLEYKFHKHFSVETQMGRQNSGGDVFFNINF